MAKLYDNSSNLLTKVVQVKPLPKAIKVERTLLNGQLDTQIIGTPEAIYEATVLVLYADMITIQTAANTGVPVKLLQEGTQYTCYIKGTPEFRLANIGIAANRHYEGRLELSVIT